MDVITWLNLKKGLRNLLESLKNMDFSGRYDEKRLSLPSELTEIKFLPRTFTVDLDAFEILQGFLSPTSFQFFQRHVISYIYFQGFQNELGSPAASSIVSEKGQKWLQTNIIYSWTFWNKIKTQLRMAILIQRIILMALELGSSRFNPGWNLYQFINPDVKFCF